MNLETTIKKHDREIIIASWLSIVLMMVFAMVVLGGFTRLTHSGLSMVEWRPLTGWFPPLSQDDWVVVFEKYKLSPEFQKINSDMEIDGFKSIFWLEYLHRLWGRIIGIAFLVPFIFFLFCGWISRGLAPKLVGLFILGGVQGVMGWYMVKSGLVDKPDVSQYRLVAHFSIALVIIGAMQWIAFELFFPKKPGVMVKSSLRYLSFFTAGWAFITAVSGGFVAGLDAGFSYNTFPLMNGDLFPPDLYQLSPFYLNFFEDVTSVQFNHRLLAEILFLIVVLMWFRTRGVSLSHRGRIAVNCLAASVLIQVTLGISTLLLMIPVTLAAVHQAGAVVVFMTALWLAQELNKG